MDIEAKIDMTGMCEKDEFVEEVFARAEASEISVTIKKQGALSAVYLIKLDL